MHFFEIPAEVAGITRPKMTSYVKLKGDATYLVIVNQRPSLSRLVSLKIVYNNSRFKPVLN